MLTFFVAWVVFGFFASLFFGLMCDVGNYKR
jgi:hypothetical protein